LYIAVPIDLSKELNLFISFELTNNISHVWRGDI
jgi:hypothetical protein